jgi:hypothetical protein
MEMQSSERRQRFTECVSTSRWTRNEARLVFAEQEASGLSVAAFAAAERIHPKPTRRVEEMACTCEHCARALPPGAEQRVVKRHLVVGARFRFVGLARDPGCTYR